MKDQPVTSTPFDVLIARSNLYAFTSAAFSAPDSPKFALLRAPEFERETSAAARLFDSTTGKDELLPYVKAIFASSGGGIQDAFMKLFGHTLSSDVSPYEMEHLKNKDVFAMSQNLADINGFYKAFGLQIDPGERADYLPVQAEFLGFILLKEALASQSGEVDHVEICREAARSFWEDHFSNWIPVFISAIQNKVTNRFYDQAACFLDHFLKFESSCFSGTVQLQRI